MRQVTALARAAGLVLAVIVLAGCVSLQYPQSGGASGPLAPSAPGDHPVGLPSGQLDLGDFRRLGEQAMIARFSREVSRRYGPGLAMSAALSDLRASQFACAIPEDRRGDAPAQICRREMRENQCVYSWEVHLFQMGGRATVERTGAFYDRLCNTNSGLLGAPPR